MTFFSSTFVYRGGSKKTEARTQLLFIIFESCHVWRLGLVVEVARLIGKIVDRRSRQVRQHWPSNLRRWTKLPRFVVCRRQGLLKMVFVLEFITRIPCIYTVARLPWVCSLTRGGEAVELTRSEARERRTARAPKDSNWTKRLCPV